MTTPWLQHAGARLGGGDALGREGATLTLEKTAVGFYLSGHLFDEVATEVRKLCQTAHRGAAGHARAAAAGRHRE